MRLCMAENLVPTSIKSPSDLVTTREETRAGFISMAIEKNYMARPFVEEAKALRTLASEYPSPNHVKSVLQLKKALLAASGLSEKSLRHLNETDKTAAIQGLIDEFLEPAGSTWIDELVYRFL